jgi:anti-sigma regulatory factor (Ser/Thr protein kinase)
MAVRAICISDDAATRHVVERALAGAGVTVEHQDRVPPATDGVVLVVVDRATRQACGDELRASGVPIVVVGDDLDDDALIALMLDAPVSHVVADPRDRDLGITSEKLVSGDFFGLEKYLAAGVPIHERVVGTEQVRHSVIGEVCAWAEARSARQPLIHRIASVVDELVMNAQLDAPRARPPADAAPTLRWAGDEQLLAVSVADAYGALRQRDVVDNVRRARRQRGRPLTSGDGDAGAGLGLYLVLANVTSLIVNLEPGRRTEVICLFELAARDRRAITRGATSLHVFAP